MTNFLLNPKSRVIQLGFGISVLELLHKQICCEIYFTEHLRGIVVSEWLDKIKLI